MIQRRSSRAICLGLIAVLYVMSVPWYRDTEAPLRVWFGLPDWVAVALLCYAAVACLNSVAWMLADVSDELSEDDDPSSASISPDHRFDSDARRDSDRNVEEVAQ